MADSKDRIYEQFEILMSSLAMARQSLMILKVLNQVKQASKIQERVLWDIKSALYTQAIVKSAALFDKDPRTISISRIIEIFYCGRDEDLNEANKKYQLIIESYASLIKTLTRSRNNFVAHTSLGASEEMSVRDVIEITEFRSLLDELFKFLSSFDIKIKGLNLYEYSDIVEVLKLRIDYAEMMEAIGLLPNTWVE